MRFLYVGVGALGFAILLWFLWPEGERMITNAPPKNDVIVALGDSLVEGVGATEGNDFVSVLGVGLGKEIINLGVAGDTTEQGLNRLHEVRKHDPGVVIVLLGGNDALKRHPLENTRSNLSQIIETLQADGAIVVLLGVRSGFFGGSYDEMFEELRETYGTLYVEDVLQGLFARSELMADAIHPNDAGYEIIANRVYEEMSVLFKIICGTDDVDEGVV